MVYDGFISYSHAADGRLTSALQQGLQRLAKQWNSRRALRIFRDETGLSTSPHLWASIEAALDDSDWFVLLASPEAAQSQWVSKEIAHWLATKSADHVLPVVTDGSWEWDAASGDFTDDSTAVPDSLRGVFSDEPRHLDLRWARVDTHLDLRNSRFRAAVADLAAPMHGIAKDELEGEDIRQHRRARALARGGVSVLVALVVVALVTSALAITGQRRAQHEANTARQATLLALSRGLAASSTSELNGNKVDLGLLLGVESYRLAVASHRGKAAEAQALRGLLEGVVSAGSISAVLNGQNGSPLLVTYSNDGSLVVSGSGTGALWVWDAHSRKLVAQPTLVDKYSGTAGSDVAINRQRILAGASLTGSVELWDLRANAPWSWQPPPPNPDENVEGAEVALTDSGVLAIAAGDGTGATPYTGSSLDLWNIDNGKRLHKTIRLAGLPEQVAFSPDGRQVAVGILLPGATQAAVQVIDVASGKTGPALLGQRGNFRPTSTERNVGRLVSLGFERDGATLSLGASESSSGAVVTWDTATGRRLRNAPTAAHAQVLTASNDGTQLVDYDSAHDVAALVDVATGATLASVTAPSSDAAAFNPNDHTFALGTTAASVLLVGASSQSASKFEVSERLTGSVTWSAISRDGRLAAGATQSGKEVQLLDVATRKPFARQPHLDAYSWAFGRDDSLAMLTPGGVVLWDPARGAIVRRLVGQPPCSPPTDLDAIDRASFADAITYAGTASNGRVVVSCPAAASFPASPFYGENSNYAAWDLHARTNRPQWRKTGPGSAVPVLSDDGSELVSEAGTTVSRLDPATGRPRAGLKGVAKVQMGVPLSGVLQGDVTFSRNGQWLAIPLEGGAIDLVNGRTGAIDRTLVPRGKPAEANPDAPDAIALDAGPMVFSPDGSLLAAWTRYGVEAWDTASGTALGTLGGAADIRGSDPVNVAVGFSTSGNQLVVIADYSTAPPLRASNTSAAMLTSKASDSVMTTWGLAADDLIYTACGVAGRSFSRTEWTAFVGTDVPYGKTC